MTKVTKNKKKSSHSDKTVLPGVYKSLVVSVASPEGFVPGNVVDITYQLTADTGEVFPYHERFYIAPPVPDRTVEFEDYLLVNGIDHYEKFIGCKEQLFLNYQVKNFHTYLNVIERTFVSAATINVSDEKGGAD